VAGVGVRRAPHFDGAVKGVVVVVRSMTMKMKMMKKSSGTLAASSVACCCQPSCESPGKSEMRSKAYSSCPRSFG